MFKGNSFHLFALAAILFSLLSCERKRYDNPYDPQNIQEPPQIVSPLEGEICAVNPPSIMWVGKRGRFEYHVLVDTNPHFPDTGYPFGDHCYDTTVLDSDDFLFHLGYCEDKPYYCKMRSASMDLYPRVWSKWSQATSFTVKFPFVDRCTLDFSPYYTIPKLISSDTIFLSDPEGNIHVYNLFPLQKLTQFSTGLEGFLILGIEDGILCGYEHDYYADSLFIAIFDVTDIQQITTLAEFALYSVGYSGQVSFSANRFSFLNAGDSIFLFDLSYYPNIDSTLFLPPYNCYDIQLVRDALYLFVYEDYSSKIIVYDISNIHSPQETCRLKFYGTVHPAATLDNFLYIDEYYGPFHVLGTSDCLHPSYEGSMDDMYIFSMNKDILVTREIAGDDCCIAFYQLENGFPGNKMGSIYLRGGYARIAQLGNNYFALKYYGYLCSFGIDID